ncbi:MAG: site-specific integrase [Roseburia inulinivorans]
MEQMNFSIEVSESEIEKFADYLYQKENAKATINKYMADIKKFLFFLADDKRINKKVLLQYKEWLVQKYAVNSVNSMLAALNQFLEFLNVGNLKVKRIKVQKQPFLQDQKEVTEKECRKLIATAMAEGKEQLALCIETIACTGIRISEIKYFTVERVKSGKIEIYNKGKYRRIFCRRYCKGNFFPIAIITK